MKFRQPRFVRIPEFEASNTEAEIRKANILQGCMGYRLSRLVYHANLRILTLILSMTFSVSAINIVGIHMQHQATSKNEISIMRMIDVGQGDSFMLSLYSGHRIAIDVGEDADTWITQAAQSDFADKRIDLLLATHDDADHAGALPTLADRLRIGAIGTSRYRHTYIDRLEGASSTRLIDALGAGMHVEFRDRASKKVSKKSDAEEGAEMGSEQAEGDVIAALEIMWPTNHGDDSENRIDKSVNGVSGMQRMRRASNADSLIFKSIISSTTVLFTGDAGIKEEEAIIESGADLGADILKVGHHGSKTSTSDRFLKKVMPTFSLVSAGKGNSYGHPHASVIESLKEYMPDDQILRTDRCGTVELFIYKSGAIGRRSCNVYGK